LEYGEADENAFYWHLNRTTREQDDKSISCTCSSDSSNTGRGSSVWGPLYAMINASNLEINCPYLPSAYCKKSNSTQPDLWINITEPDLNTPAGVAAARAMLKNRTK
jgi:hypothetical protein